MIREIMNMDLWYPLPMDDIYTKPGKLSCSAFYNEHGVA
jgi:hypothetical protein